MRLPGSPPHHAPIRFKGYAPGDPLDDYTVGELYSLLGRLSYKQEAGGFPDRLIRSMKDPTPETERQRIIDELKRRGS